MSEATNAPNTTDNDAASEGEDAGGEDLYDFAKTLLADDDGEGEEETAPQGDPETPEPVKTEEAKATPPAPPEPSLDDRIKQAAERSLAEREAKREQERAKQELEDARKAIADERAKIEELRRSYERDPIEFLKRTGYDVTAAYDRLHKAALDPKGDQIASKVEAKLAEIDAYKQSLEERERQQAQYAAVQAEQRKHEESKQAFQAHVSQKATEYPLLMRLPDNRRIAYAINIADRLTSEGKAFDFDIIAMYAEQEIRDLAASLGIDPVAAPKSDAPTPTGSSGQKKPTTISAAQTTERAGLPEDETHEDRMAAAYRLAREALK